MRRTEPRSTRWRCALVLPLLGLAAAFSPAGAEYQAPAGAGVAISYRLPTTGHLPRTYRVTLAITDVKNPNWIISTFLAGAPRTVTAENGGRFTEIWNGLDDNFMPVPPGTYGVEGIYMPARKWALTGEYHTYIPKFVAAVGDSWAPSRKQDRKLPWMWGAAFGTMADIAVGPGGKAVFFHNYFEGSGNPLIVDLNKPIGYDQVIRSFPPGGVAGGPAIATDGKIIWGVSDASSPPFIFRVDRKPFGHGRSRYFNDVYVPTGVVTSLAAWDNTGSGHPFLYAAQSQHDDGVLVLDGDNGTELARLPMTGARAVTVRGGFLYALGRERNGTWTIVRAALGSGVPILPWRKVTAVGGIADPADFKVGRGGFVYVSDLHANQVYKLDPAGRIVLRFGHGTRQRPGHYDHHIFMSPSKLALWIDAKGQERLLVIERSGPSRVSEWSTDGKLLREWFTGQTQAVFGYAVDPDNPELIYMATSRPGSGSGLVRFRVNYTTGKWDVDAVWPDICGWGRFPGGTNRPEIIDHAGRKYLAFQQARESEDRYGIMLYRQQGDRWIPSAGLFPPPDSTAPPKPGAAYWWHDANGSGKLEATGYLDSPAKLPSAPRYFGEAWLDDLSLVFIKENGRSLWRIAPSGFDAHGNPIYDGSKWQRLVTDPIFAARTKGNAEALHGGNEIADSFNVDWSSVAGDLKHGLFVNGYNGPTWPDGIDSTGRRASEVKISYYAPNRRGGLTLKWRVGRKAFAIAKPGEMYGTLHVTPPIDHILTVTDGNGLIHLFTDKGLYVDTLLYDQYRHPQADGGVYAVGGELWSGFTFLNPESGQVYIASGRNSASLFEIEGWTGGKNGILPITTLPKSVSIRAGQIFPAPDSALRARGGAGMAKVARFYPATGGSPALDGSLAGWQASEPAIFALDKDRSVHVRTLYDPETLYLRWHIRLPNRFEAKPVAALDRLFADDLGLDTLSLYLQDDPDAKPGVGSKPRPGDMRVVFALIREGERLRPVAVAYYPFASGGEIRHPASFATAVGRMDFADVRPLEGTRLGYAIDTDGKGFVIAAAIDRRDLPMLPPLSGALRTLIDFAATFDGKAKVWWANADGSASTVTSDEPSEAGFFPGAWAQAQFVALDDSLPVRVWLVLGPWGGEPLKTIRPNDWKGLLHFFSGASYPPDSGAPNWDAFYSGALTMDFSGDEHLVRWRPMLVQTSDNQLHLGLPGRLYYAASWIYAPKNLDIDCSFMTERENITTVRINGDKLRSQTLGRPPTFTVPLEHQPIHLHRGWNSVFVRTYAAGYDLNFGMSLHAAAGELWQIRFSPTPPSK